ncbi:hypothetical protein [Paraburkholderia sp. SOS3]|jgi:hypothetical protein|uniref:hypothetical protein n=1 Tax=Paraburkholderia sp. SOS3 TaxID=1926494 RepID=UPI00094753F3|nr:hypothetical protein [Paraburkholderia sp. SOS3]APR37950.1 hypothetical protein BTO02_20575 [Paraburkholderia sp. SOS3]
MKKQTVVTIIKRNPANDYVRKSLPERVDIIRDACAETEYFIKNRNQNINPSDIRAVVIAPEYFLSKNYIASLGREALFIHRNEMLAVREEIAKISEQYKNVVIIPGTVGYLKEVTPLRAVKALDRLAAETGQGLALTLPSGIGSYAEYKEFWRLKLSDPAAAFYIYSNSMFAFFNGNIWKHRKTLGFHENKDAPEHILSINRTDESFVADIAGRAFGLEICFEHAMGSLTAFPNTAAVDFHIVASDYVVRQDQHVKLKSDGYFIHASTEPGQIVVHDFNRREIYVTARVDQSLNFYVINTPEPAYRLRRAAFRDTKPVALS